MGNRVIVIGGGISGLSTAYWMTRAGLDVTVLEREGRGGGCIRSERQEGYLIDHTANCLLNFLPEVNQLCNEVGVSHQAVTRTGDAKFRYLVKDGRLQPLPNSLSQFLTSRLWSQRAKLRFLLEPVIPGRRGRRRADPSEVGGAVTEESVAQFVKRRFGQEVLDYAVEPFVGGNHAGDVNNLSMVSTFPQLVQMEERYGSLVLGSMIRRFKGSKIGSVAHLFSFQEGMEVLPKAIVKYLGPRFSPGIQVTGIEPQGEVWTVTGTTGSRAGVGGKEQRWTADAVVVTAPAFASARILGPLSGVLQGLLAGVDYAPVGVVYLGFSRNQITHRMDGLGYLAPRREDGFVLGSLWNSVLFPNRAPFGKVALTNYVGGMRWPGTLDLSDNTLLEKTLQDLKRLLGIYGEPEFVKILRHPKAIPQYTLGHAHRLQGIKESLQKFPGLFISGNYLSGVSMRDCISLGVKVAGNVREYLHH